MELDAKEALSSYKQLLSLYSNSTRRIQWKRTAQQLECLAKYAIDKDDEITTKVFEEALYEEFVPNNFKGYISLGGYSDFVSSYDGLFYKLQYLKGHISDEWFKLCKMKYLSLVIDLLPQFLNRCCDDYIFEGKNCLQDAVCIFECIRYYESSFESKSNDHSSQLTQFTRELLSRVIKWVGQHENDFGRIYVIWKKTEEILKLDDSDTFSNSPAFQLFSNDRQLLVPKTLKNYVLSPDTVFSVYGRGGYDKSYEFDIHDVRHYYSGKGLRWKHDFDLLLRDVILVDDFRCRKNLCKRDSLKHEFEESLGDLNEFHIELFNYIQGKFQENYNEIRKDPHTAISRSEEMWINALSTFLIHYLRSLEDFMHLILRRLILPQLLSFSGKFKQYYLHKACLERHVFDNVSRSGSVSEFKESIDSITKLTIDSDEINVNGPTVEKLFMSRPIAEKLDLLPEDEPIWPNEYFKNYWEHQKQLFSSQGKTLHGCFEGNLITMKLPIPSSNKTRITLITSISIASILNLYNDSKRLTIDEIRVKLAINNSKESILQDSLRKIVDYGLINLTKDNFYIFNYQFKKTSSSEKFLKLF